MYTINDAGCLCLISDSPQYQNKIKTQQYCFKNKNIPCSISCTAFKYNKEENTAELLCLKRKINLIKDINYINLDTSIDHYKDLDILTETYSG